MSGGRAWDRRVPAPRSRTGLLAGLVMALLGGSLWLAPSSNALLFVSLSPLIPDAVVGETVPGSVGLSNRNTTPDNFPVSFSGIDVHPACFQVPFAQTDCAGGTVEAGVYALSPTGAGRTVPPVNATCEGTWTITQISPGRYRFTPPGGEGSLVLNPGETCIVNFSATALRVPAGDVSPGQAGVQTYHATGASPMLLRPPAAGGSLPLPRRGDAATSTVARASTRLTTVASPSIAPIGSSATDTATLSPSPPSFPDGVPPTGTITFRLYPPGDVTCVGVPAFSAVKPVNGFGDAQSSPFVATRAGTYRWVASYSGDTNYLPVGPTACGDPAEMVTFTRTQPILVTRATPSARIGRPILDTATLSGGLNPTGTITFVVFGPNDPTCAGPPAFTTTVLVAGNRSYDSGSFVPSAPGTYRWVASYGGDANNSPAATSCGDPSETTVVTRLPIFNSFDGDEDTDIAIYRPSDGTWYIRSIGAFPWGGIAGDVPVPADYDGDRDTDIAIYRPSNGTWYIRSTGAFPWGGIPGDIPAPGDYDGDGDADIAIYRPSNGTWYIRGIGAIPWGGFAGDVPVPADYNGDGRTDIAVYRTSTGVWYIRGVGAFAYGSLGDVPVPQDYDGDGDADVAIYRPATGQWFVRDISAVYWGGVGGDVAQLGTYDSDPAAEQTVYRNGVWWVREVGAFSFGSPGDVPVNLPFAIRQAFFP